jgi:hypothetical protein
MPWRLGICQSLVTKETVGKANNEKEITTTLNHYVQSSCEGSIMSAMQMAKTLTPRAESMTNYKTLTA